tara:strand:- start:6543 stop:6731 length:189 start_codon:yes stop_codon:yes gene_type:complete
MELKDLRDDIKGLLSNQTYKLFIEAVVAKKDEFELLDDSEGLDQLMILLQDYKNNIDTLGNQ